MIEVPPVSLDVGLGLCWLRASRDLLQGVGGGTRNAIAGGAWMMVPGAGPVATMVCAVAYICTVTR